MQKIDPSKFKDFLLQLQTDICDHLEQIDPVGKFKSDNWDRSAGGSGLSRVISGDGVFEKGGVNFSHVYGKAMPASASAQRPDLAGKAFEAMGLSLVIHPKNPFIPTSHANFRLFLAQNDEKESVWWFGGGYDLTPYYGFEEDVIHWHKTARDACSPFGSDIYPSLKKACDEYFYLPHRKEPRGVGGIFFEDWKKGGFDESFAFVRSIGNNFIQAYEPILTKRKSMEYTQRQKEHQLYRRGRYVEFNLLYDRGTRYGIQSGRRIESVLASMPPMVKFTYDKQNTPGSPEHELYTKYLITKDWI